MKRLSCSKCPSSLKADDTGTCVRVRFAAKLDGVDPEAYLWGVLDRIASGHSISRTMQLIRWNSLRALVLSL